MTILHLKKHFFMVTIVNIYFIFLITGKIVFLFWMFRFCLIFCWYILFRNNFTFVLKGFLWLWLFFKYSSLTTHEKIGFWKLIFQIAASWRHKKKCLLGKIICYSFYFSKSCFSLSVWPATVEMQAASCGFYAAAKGLG